MEKKKVILTLCKSFPVTHSKAGEATDFEKKLKDKSKIHTIRYNAKNVWDGRYKDIVSGKKYLSIREWTGRPYNSEQKEIAQLPKIGLQHVTMTYSSEDAYPEIWIDNKKVSIHEVAKNDGLSVEDFVEWFFGNNKENVFEGVDGMDGILGVENFDTSLAEGVMLLTPFAADADDEKTKAFVSTYKEKYGDVPNQFAADAYDAIYVIKAAIEQAGATPDMSASDLGTALTGAMTSISVDGLTGEGMTWQATGEVSKAPKAVVIKDGAYAAM